MKAIIEIPKGNDRRWHLNYARTAIEDFGPIKDKIPVNDGIMPVDYGYLEGTENKDEKDNVDVLIFSSRRFNVGDSVEVEPFGLIRRSDKDHKVLAADNTSSIKTWNDVPLPERELILEYFSYNHPILGVESKESSEAYIRGSLNEN